MSITRYVWWLVRRKRRLEGEGRLTEDCGDVDYEKYEVEDVEFAVGDWGGHYGR